MAKSRNSSFLAIGIVFLVIGLTTHRALLAVGIAFIAIALARRKN